MGKKIRKKSDLVNLPLRKSTLYKIKRKKISPDGEKVPLYMVDGIEKVSTFGTKTPIDQEVHVTHSHGAARYVALFAHLGLIAGIYKGAGTIPNNVCVTSALHQDLSGKMEYTDVQQSIDAAHLYGAGYKNMDCDLGVSKEAQSAIKYVNDLTGKTALSIGGSIHNQGKAERSIDNLNIEIAKDFFEFLKSDEKTYKGKYKSKLTEYHDMMINKMIEVSTEFIPETNDEKEFKALFNAHAADEYRKGMKGASTYMYRVYDDAYEVGLEFGSKV